MQSTLSKGGGGWPLHPIRGADLVSTSISDTTTYTVPAGKAFVMCAIQVSSGSNAGWDVAKADGTAFWRVGSLSTSKTIVTDQWRATPGDSTGVVGDNWAGTSSTATTITSTPNITAGGTTVVRAPWLRVWAPGTVISTQSGASGSISGYLVPVSLL